MKSTTRSAIGIMIITLCVINQFANAQTCSCRHKNKTYASSICDPNNLIEGKHHGCCVRIFCQTSNDGATYKMKEYDLIISPNPVSSSTKISFTLSQAQNVLLKILDLNGRTVKVLAEQILDEGENEFVWDADEVNAGIYFLRMQTDKFLHTEKLIVTE